MFTIGLDLHKLQTQLCIGHEDGTFEELRIATTRDRFTAVLANYRPTRILLEASTESEWVARHLEQLGHEVIVADPNFAPMYATRTRRTKTDRRDARTLMHACQLGAYRRAHRSSDERRHVRAELAVRDALVRTRTRYIALIKALLRRDGLRLNSTASHLFAQRIAALDASPQLRAELQPLLDLLAPLNAQIDAADERISALERTDAAVALLMSAPGIGAITASAVVATIDDITRFATAHQLEAYLGMVPGELSSGEKRHIGPITKAGNKRVRYLLVEAAWRILASKQTDTAALRAWAQRIVVRRGKRIAAVALARRLAGILYAMWRDNAPYSAQKIRMPRSQALARAS
jgi:transposase